MSGWICLHRPLLKHWIYDEPEALKFWVTLLMNANWETKTTLFNKRLVTVERGQIVFGRKVFSARLGISEKKLRRYCEMLEVEGMIGQQKTSRYTLITVLNYSQYQDKGQQTASEGPAEGQQTATSKQVNNKTSKQKDSSPAKAEKRKRSLPNDFILTKKKANLAMKYWSKKNRNDLDVRDIFEQFTTYCKAHGKTYLDWDSAWQTWYVNAIKFERENKHGNNTEYEYQGNSV